MKILSVAAVVSLFVLPGSAGATGDWDATGMACQFVDSPSSYVNDSGGVKHASGVTGTIALQCNIPNQSDVSTPTHISLLYTDSSNTASNQVLAVLYKRSKTNGALSEVARIDTDGSAMNQSSVCTQSGPTYCINDFTATWDPGNYYYFVVVYLARTSTSNTETFWGVSLY